MTTRTRPYATSWRDNFIISVAAFLLTAFAFAGIATAQNPVPLINQPLMPDAVKPGGTGFTLTVNGTGFVSGATVDWNGSLLKTTFVSSSQLTASVPASDIATAGTASVTVVNPSPGGGTSNVVFFSITVAASPLAFNKSDLNSGGGGADSVTTGDFNGNGRVDLVVANDLGSNVGVLLSNGDGTFQPEVNYPTDAYPDMVVVGDFNGDGKLDLAVRSQFSFTVSVLLGNGDGTFQPFKTTGTTSCNGRLAEGDFNGDGKLDLACTSSSADNVAILLGNGDGTFQSEVDYAVGSGADAIAIGDFNRDGKLDLAITQSNGVSILLGNSDGSFQAPVAYATANPPADSVNAADFNGDGILDLAVPTQNSAVSIFLGNGDGTFKPARSFSTGSGNSPARSAVADLNGDGKPDLAVTGFNFGYISVLLGKGDGSFQAPLQYATGPLPLGVTAADFKGDGQLDLAVADNGASAVSVLLQIPAVSLSKTSLTFADQLIGTNSTSQTVTLINGGLKLTISSVAVTGTNASDFSQTNTCDPGLPPGGKCTITVTFAPTHIGPCTASVTITDNAGGSPQEIALSGTGVVSGPNATLSPTSLTFATQLVGTTSLAQTVRLSDYGTVALSNTSIGFMGADPGDFHQTNTCASSVAPGASCTISVTFKPTQHGTRTATLSITDNAPGNPQTVSLSGTGTVVDLNPASLSFGVVEVGKSKNVPTTLTNVGTTTLSINTITITGTDADEFSQTNTCDSSVGAGTSCTITVTFKPSERGSDSADVSISDNGGGSPQQVPLSGAGCTVINRHCKTTPLSSSEVQSALAANRTVAVPRSTEPSPVGTRVMELVDSTRDDPFLANGTKREMLVRFWYPASVDRRCKLAEYTSPGVWKYFSELTRLPLPQVTTNSCLDAPVADGAHPIVVFTHGYTGTFTDYTFLFEDLASRGYVVASIDHTYEETAVEFPDGRFVKSLVGSHLANTWRTDDQSLYFALSVRLDDLKFVLNELERLNTSSANPFAGKLDVTKVALAGHSFGGLTTWDGVQQDTRFKAGILLDPYLSGASVESTETPVMLLTMGREQHTEEECRLWSNLLGPRFSVNLGGAEHVTPSDAVWLAKPAIKTGAMGPDKTIGAMRDYIAAFLDANLRGKAFDPLLTGPSSKYPDVTVIRQNQFLCGEFMKHSSNTDHGESR